MFESIVMSVPSKTKTKTIEGVVYGLSFFSEIKQQKKYSRVKLLFHCDRCRKNLLLKSRAEIQAHIQSHRERGECLRAN